MKKTVLFLSSFAAAFAHPGHGSTESGSVMHNLEPIHFIVFLALAGTATFLIAKKAKKKSN